MIDREAIQTIEAILKRGNDAEIRRKGSGYIILEVKKTIRCTATDKKTPPTAGGI